MPHAISPQDTQDAQDEVLIQQALDPQSTLDFSRELEPGEKADDAIDFGDLGDDDLAEDDAVPAHRLGENFSSAAEFAESSSKTYPIFGDLNVSHDAFDELFGEETITKPEPAREGSQDHDSFLRLTNTFNDQGLTQPIHIKTQDRPISREQQVQQELFALSSPSVIASHTPPEPPTNDEELLAALWPKFKRNATPRFMEILPPKRARYMGKQLLKTPRPVNPSKLNLEVAQDQVKAFKISTGQNLHAWVDTERSLNVIIDQNASVEDWGSAQVKIESDNENDDVYGTSWRDLQILCEDWDLLDIVDTVDIQGQLPVTGDNDLYDSMVHDGKTAFNHNLGATSTKVSHDIYFRKSYILTLHPRNKEQRFPLETCWVSRQFA